MASALPRGSGAAAGRPDAAVVLLLSGRDRRAGPASRILVSHCRRIGRRLRLILDNGQRFAWRLSRGALPVSNTVTSGPPTCADRLVHEARPQRPFPAYPASHLIFGYRVLFIF